MRIATPSATSPFSWNAVYLHGAKTALEIRGAAITVDALASELHKSSSLVAEVIVRERLQEMLGIKSH